MESVDRGFSTEWGGLLMSPSMKAVDGSDADYDLHVARDAAGEYVTDFDPVIQRWVEMSTHTTVWTTVYRESLSKMVRGCAVGIGDAVHPHLPHHGQGASSAIEDGASLAPFLDTSDGSLTQESLPARLKAWEGLRMPRARMVHMLSIRWPAPLDQIQPEIRQIYDGPLPKHNKDHTEVMWDFLFGYDVVAEAKKAVRDLKDEGAM
jgi:salicylate hydroxylase